MFENLNNAVARKNHILNNRNAYNYAVEIETKNKIDYDIGRWFRAKYEYRTHKELRFDHNRYNNDLQQVTQEINNWQNAINNEIHNMENQLNSTISQKNSASNSLYYAQNQLSDVNYQLSSANTIVQNLRNSISVYKNQYNELVRKHSELNSQIELQNKNNSGVSSQIQNTNLQISAIRQEIETKNNQETRNKSQIQSTKESSKNLDKQIQDLDKEIIEVITSSSPQERAILFADCYLKLEFEQITEAIESLGLDVDYLAHIAVKQKNCNLVRFATENNADFVSTSIKEVGNKTLLQYAIQNNCSDIINLILSQEDISLSDTLLNAMNQSDTSTVAKIFGYENGKFAHIKIYGHTLLHIAIDAGQKEVVEKILEVCRSAINDTDDYGNSALKVAIKTENIGMINLIAKKLDIEKAALDFIKNDNLMNLEEMIKYELLSKEIKINLLHSAKFHNKLDAIKILLESDSTINFEYQDQILFDWQTNEQEQNASQLEYIDLDMTQNLLGQESSLNLQQNPDL